MTNQQAFSRNFSQGRMKPSVQSSDGLLSSLLYTIRVSMMYFTLFLMPPHNECLMVFFFSIPFGFVNLPRTFVAKQNHPLINMFQNGMDPHNNSCLQRFSHLDTPIIYQYFTSITILTPTYMLMLIDTMHSPTYIPNQHRVSSFFEGLYMHNSNVSLRFHPPWQVL